MKEPDAAIQTALNLLAMTMVEEDLRLAMDCERLESQRLRGELIRYMGADRDAERLNSGIIDLGGVVYTKDDLRAAIDAGIAVAVEEQEP